MPPRCRQYRADISTFQQPRYSLLFLPPAHSIGLETALFHWATSSKNRHVSGNISLKIHYFIEAYSLFHSRIEQSLMSNETQPSPNTAKTSCKRGRTPGKRSCLASPSPTSFFQLRRLVNNFIVRSVFWHEDQTHCNLFPTLRAQMPQILTPMPLILILLLCRK